MRGPAGNRRTMPVSTTKQNLVQSDTRPLPELITPVFLHRREAPNMLAVRLGPAGRVVCPLAAVFVSTSQKFDDPLDLAAKI